MPAGTTDRLQILPDPAGVIGNNVLSVNVMDGDIAVNANGSPIPGGWRAEVIGPEEDGSTEWVRFAWSTRIDAAYPDNPLGEDGRPIWQVITQWHQGDSDVGGSPPIAFVLVGDEIRLHIHRPDPANPANSLEIGQYFIAKFDRGSWHRFEMDVRWNLSDGWVTVRHNGTQAVALKQLPTLFPPQSGASRPPTTYMKMGLYRRASATGLSSFVLQHDDVQKWIPVCRSSFRSIHITRRIGP